MTRASTVGETLDTHGPGPIRITVGIWRNTDRGVRCGARILRRLEDLTISMCQFDHFGPVIVSDSVDELLHSAVEQQSEICVFLATGRIMVRHQDHSRCIDSNLIKSLREWALGHEFLVMGDLTFGPNDKVGLLPGCFAVDLVKYLALDRPSFSDGAGRTAGKVRLASISDDAAEIMSIEPSGGEEILLDPAHGGSFIQASLSAGLRVCGLNETMRRTVCDLWPKTDPEARLLETLLGPGIASFDLDRGANPLLDRCGQLLRQVQIQVTSAQKGVFLFNYENYDDIAELADRVPMRVNRLYSVAAGFKPNRILEVFGFSEDTKIVFFDYSKNALKWKKGFVTEWDGTDLVDFVLKYASETPDAYYHIGTNPELLREKWDREIDRWGGARIFASHWRRYAGLRHDFVLCDVIRAPGPLLDCLEDSPGSVIWWSDTFYSASVSWLWLFDQSEVETAWRHWLGGLSGRCPDLLSIGVDLDNRNISGVTVENLKSGLPTLDDRSYT